LVAGLLVLAVPAAVWAGAAADQIWGSCDPTGCGDRDRGWFMLVLVTAPLIPFGGFLVARDLRPGALATLGRLVCLLACGVFMVLGLGLVAGGVGAFVDYVRGDYAVNLGDPEGSEDQALTDVGLWAAAALWCFTIAYFLLLARRRLSRRYPSGSWPPSGKSTSAG
jgi:hypothetical protein